MATGRIYDDGVNVAARLNGIAEPDGAIVTNPGSGAIGRQLDATRWTCRAPKA